MLRTLVVSAFLLISARAAAWGHIQNLDGPMKPAYLFSRVREHHEIRYCVLVASEEQARFSPDSIATQTEGVLTSWLEAVQEKGISTTKIVRSTCEVGKMDLIVRIEKASETEKGKAAYFKARTNETKDVFWGLVRIVSDHVSTTGSQWKDMKDWVVPSQSLPDLLHELTYLLRSTTVEFAVRRNVPKEEMFYNTYCRQGSTLFTEG